MTDAQGHVAHVRATLAAAGITPTDDEVAILARRLPDLRRQVDRLHAVAVGDGPLVSLAHPAEA